MKDSEVQIVTDGVTKTDFNSIFYCVPFDSGVEEFLGMFFSLGFLYRHFMCVSIKHPLNSTYKLPIIF